MQFLFQHSLTVGIKKNFVNTKFQKQITEIFKQYRLQWELLKGHSTIFKHVCQIRLFVVMSSQQFTTGEW